VHESPMYNTYVYYDIMYEDFTASQCFVYLVEASDGPT